MSPLRHIIATAALLVGVLSGLRAAEVLVPAGPNSWVFDHTGTCVAASAITTNKGITRWTDPTQRIRIYVWLGTSGTLNVRLHGMIADGEATIRCTLGEESRQITLAQKGPGVIEVGTFTIARPGYHHLELQGLTKTAHSFGEITGVGLTGAVAAGEVHFLRDDFHFGRRGPSVHLGYQLPENAKDITYVYSEVCVPVGQDVIGTFCMANGFSAGYSGMQVNSAKERRILFSVWSPFQTDDPKKIPEADRIVLLGKGTDVQVGTFGNEGSGGQSFLRFPWQAGTTYRFLLRGEPTGDGSTVFTCYFFPPELGRWLLIASFRRPKTDTYVTGWHSFLENFATDTGAITREAHYTNQWARDRHGQWFAVSQARYTADATARKQARLDYAGGVTPEGRFFLRNGGFFNERLAYGATFTRTPSPDEPQIDLVRLPQE